MPEPDSAKAPRTLLDHHFAEAVGLFGQPAHPFRDGAFRSNNDAFRIAIGNDGWGRRGSPEKTLQVLLWDDTNRPLPRA
ncbi:hypothetical protein [Streptomyces sp. CB01881]|uniref:hypothetical protein n=1 Tax=Streptomyces sp. CB01881 TaxID=2078691 RepID=UPI000CDBEB79|nr:hypothetical protein [Streptomyces sp. CB01881]AUY53053.1 hypothetical protein C2142_33710 [Streptomyces sp. CB01881]TYC70768.1 hypothetical protein EH183_33770 [Streptomyces sp. CB01881]